MNHDPDRQQMQGGGDLTTILLRALLRRAPLIVAVALIVGIAAVGASFLVTPQYTASATLLPQTGSSSSGLMAAIGSFANLPLQGEQSLEGLYPVILRSDRILDGVIGQRFGYRGGQESLYSIFGVPEPAQADSVQSARRLKRLLRESVVSLSQDKKTGVMQLSVNAPQDADFAADLANALTDSLGSFIVEFNSAKAREKLNYVNQRLDEVQSELQAAESARTAFMEENRTYAASPRLSQQAGELERQVQALTAVWVELIKQLEIAKLDDDKERFSLEILDRAQPPLTRSKPNRASMGVIGTFLGGMLACLFVLGRAALRPSSA